ncbi:MAG: acyl-CoA desaturase [Chitinivibrionales bacterium]|nr:acyl-CoA desaturase [Chitinivibrionales bacterium]
MGRSRTGTGALHAKTAIILSSFVLSYGLLVFWAENVVAALGLAVLLGLSAAGIGMNIQHDAGHGAYSRRGWANRLAAMSLNLIGGNSYVWKWKHTRFHHTFVNITDYDSDLDFGGMGRVTPYQKKRWFHRWQQFYLWPLYSLLAIKWQFIDDFLVIAQGRLGVHEVPRPKGWALLLFVSGKAVFFTLAFFVPLLMRPWPQVLLFYLSASLVAGIYLSLIFILPHTVEDSIFPVPAEGKGRIDTSRTEHQARVTADFARSSRLFTWLVGALNFHREHHLFPSICHLHTPALAPIIDAVCEQYGIPHTVHRSYSSGIVSHYRLLRRMGRE